MRVINYRLDQKTGTSSTGGNPLLTMVRSKGAKSEISVAISFPKFRMPQ